MPQFGSVLLTGASSGIGRALAEACAAPGVSLHLSGRDAQRLDAVAASCRARGATVRTQVIDVRDAAAMASWVAGRRLLDLVVANAGIAPNATPGEAETAAKTRAVFATNGDGVLEHGAAGARIAGGTAARAGRAARAHRDRRLDRRVCPLAGQPRLWGIEGGGRCLDGRLGAAAGDAASR